MKSCHFEGNGEKSTNMSLVGCLCSFNFGTLILLMAACIGIIIGSSVYVSRSSYVQVNPTSTNTLWATVGGITHQTAEFRVRNTRGGSVILDVFENNSEKLVSSTEIGESLASHSLTNLTASTRYNYQLKSADHTMNGTFTTFPEIGQQTSFSIVTAGCAWTGSKSQIFQEAARVQSLVNNQPDPLFMLQMGDLHYADYNGIEIEQRLADYDTVFGNPVQSALYNAMALVYMWDDHDFLGNDSSEESEVVQQVSGETLSSLNVARQSFDMAIPSYRRNESNIETFSSPYHAFSVGSVRFIVTDLRSECQPSKLKMYSDTQKAWLYQEIQDAVVNYDYIVWVSTKPWNGPNEEPTASDPAGPWSTLQSDRTELSNHILQTLKSNNKTTSDFLVVSSDAHMVAFDDGTNTYFGDDPDFNEPFIPVLQSGPLDRFNSIKGGPYSDGCYTTGNKMERSSQYSIVEFVFPADAATNNIATETPCVRIKSYTIDYQVIYQREWCQNGTTRAAAGPDFDTDQYRLNTDTSTNCEALAMISQANQAVLVATACISLFGIQLASFFCPICDKSCARDKKLRLCYALGTSLVVTISLILSLALGAYIPYKALRVGQMDMQLIFYMALGQALLALLFVIGWRFQARLHRSASSDNKGVRFVHSNDESAQGEMEVRLE